MSFNLHVHRAFKTRHKRLRQSLNRPPEALSMGQALRVMLLLSLMCWGFIYYAFHTFFY